MIWKNNPTLEGITMINANTMVDHLGIEMVELGDDYLMAKMPVDRRTKQPMGLLHGGASVTLAESLGSIASVLTIEDMSKQSVVGIEINANHLKSAKSGYVLGKAYPIKLGRRLHVWQIDIKDEDGNMVCTSRLTTMIIDNKS